MNTPPVAPSLSSQLKSHSLVGAKADYARARSRQPVLSAYPTPESAVAALRSPRPDVLVDVLLVEAQLGARSLQEVLLQGLLPRLVKIRQRGEKLLKDVDTLESLLVLAFAEAVAAYPVGERHPSPSTYLLGQTRRLFLKSVLELYEVESRLVPVGLEVLTEEPEWSDPPRETGAPIDAANDPGGYTDEASALLERLAEAHVPVDKLALVAATMLHDERVLEYVDRRQPRLGREVRHRQARKLRRQRRKTIARLRRVLPAMGLSPKHSHR